MDVFGLPMPCVCKDAALYSGGFVREAIKNTEAVSLRDNQPSRRARTLIVALHDLGMSR
jgi:hypothetical protein